MTALLGGKLPPRVVIARKLGKQYMDTGTDWGLQNNATSDSELPLCDRDKPSTDNLTVRQFDDRPYTERIQRNLSLEHVG